jgi:hypothetical protein
MAIGRRPRRALVPILACAIGGLIALPAAAGAHEGHELAPGAVRAIAGDTAVETDDGLIRVAPSVGAPVFTHGPDARASLETKRAPLGADGTGFVPGALERPVACATDFYTRVVYAHLAGTQPRLAQAAPRIRSVVGRMNAALNSESLASGGGAADLKFLCDGSGAARIDALTVAAGSFDAVVAAARAAGLSSDRANVLVFLDGSLGGSCGIASYENDPRLTIDNLSNSGGGFALVYEPCWDTETAMHETAHLMGAVQSPAPNSTGTGGHCNEGADVMCYSPDGGDRNQGPVVERCPGALRFDCNFDDYFDAAPEAGEYLSSHWNVGSTLNRFIQFSGAPAEGAGAAAAARKRERLGRKRGASGLPGEWRRFEVRVPARAELLRVRLFAGPGADLGLFVRRAGEPTRELFACRETLRARHASCRIEDPVPGRWHAGVLTRRGPVGVGFRVSARAR